MKKIWSGANLKLKIILANGERRVKMNRIHCVLLTILSVAGLTFAADNCKVAVASLRNGYFDITNLSDGRGHGISYSTEDCLGGIYLYVKSDFLENSYRDYISFAIGKKLQSEKNEKVWVLTAHSNLDSLNSELKKGNSLTLEKFTKLEFDSIHVQYFLTSTPNRNADIVIKREDFPPEDSITGITPMNVTSENYFVAYDYILYQKDDSLTALCGLTNSVDYIQVACFYQNNGSFVFDSLPNLAELTDYGGCSSVVSDCPSSLYTNYTIDKRNNFDFPLYKVNGIPASKNSSNIVIQNKKQPKLKLKGIR